MALPWLTLGASVDFTSALKVSSFADVEIIRESLKVVRDGIELY
jgi:hypothetical protein